MSRFWPEGLSVNDMQSPYEILETAREEWETASNGVLTLVFQETETQDNGNMIITVHAKHVQSNRTATLLSIIHRLKEPYPVTILPINDDIPSILKKSYSVPKSTLIGTVISIANSQNPEEIITNKWVSDDASEFSNKLHEAFNLSVVKAAISNLSSSVKRCSEC